jgi:uncharacterized protein (TIGR02466 family)
MTMPEIYSLFPVPVLGAKLQRKFTSEEILYIQQQKKHLRKSTGGNYSSVDTRVLDNVYFQDIKTYIQSQINYYVANILCPKNYMELKITESWLNWTDCGQSHTEHTHSNSYISGVLYIDVDEIQDRITFINQSTTAMLQNVLSYDIEEYNTFNSMSWWLPVEVGSLLLFPSVLPHTVKTIEKSRKTPRTSLSFNTWFAPKTILGNREKSTLLEI